MRTEFFHKLFSRALSRGVLGCLCCSCQHRARAGAGARSRVSESRPGRACEICRCQIATSPITRNCDTSPVESYYKFGAPDPEDREFKYPNVWAAEKMSDGGSRLVVAPETGQVELMIRLLNAMSGPFWLLYVLVVNRGGGELGRYQSPEPQTKEDVEAFLRDFRAFLEKDGRHNFWIASPSGSEMLIYDRHNVVYAYGSPSN
jgi:hypothetical protein